MKALSVGFPELETFHNNAFWVGLRNKIPRDALTIVVAPYNSWIVDLLTDLCKRYNDITAIIAKLQIGGRRIPRVGNNDRQDPNFPTSC